MKHRFVHFAMVTAAALITGCASWYSSIAFGIAPDSDGERALLKCQASSTGQCTFEIRSSMDQAPRRFLVKAGAELSVPIVSREALFCVTVADQANWRTCDRARLDHGVWVTRTVQVR